MSGAVTGGVGPTYHCFSSSWSASLLDLESQVSLAPLAAPAPDNRSDPRSWPGVSPALTPAVEEADIGTLDKSLQGKSCCKLRNLIIITNYLLTFALTLSYIASFLHAAEHELWRTVLCSSTLTPAALCFSPPYPAGVCCGCAGYTVVYCEVADLTPKQWATRIPGSSVTPWR